MKKNIIIILMLFVTALLYGLGQNELLGDETYMYDLSDFSGIDGSGSYIIEIQKGEIYSVKVIADKSIKDELVIEKRGDDLYLGFEPFSGNIRKSPKVIIIMPDLTDVQLSGASELIAAGFDSDNDFNCELSGSSVVNIDISAVDVTFDLSGSSDIYGILEADSIIMEISGSSDIELYGSSDFLEIDSSGASKGNLKGLSVNNADLELSGSSDFYLNLNGKLNLDASGASTVYYTGNVILGDVDLSGSSTIKEE